MPCMLLLQLQNLDRAVTRFSDQWELDHLRAEPEEEQPQGVRVQLG